MNVMVDKGDPKKAPGAILGRNAMPPPSGPDDKTVIRAPDDDEEFTPPKPQYQPPYMVIVDGPRAGAHFPLGDGPNIIGRSVGCAIRLEDQSVSRQHSEVAKGTSGWTVKDLGSKNGTNVNGRPIAETVVIGHKDIVKVGIYHLRLITQQTTLEDEMRLPTDVPASVLDRTVFVSAPPDGQTERVEQTSKEVRLPEISEGEEKEKVGRDTSAGTAREKIVRRGKALLGNKRQVIMMAALGVALIVVAAYFANRILFAPKKVSPKPVESGEMPAEPQVMPSAEGGEAPPISPDGATGAPGEPPVPPEGGGTAPTGQGTPQSGQPAPSQPVQPQIPPMRKIPVFLDFASSPMPAGVIFQGESLGKTPLRVNVELEPDKGYEVEASFDMPELKEQYTQKQEFKVASDSNVIPILFRGPIGMIKISDLPRDVEFYLEGKFSYDKFSERSAKLAEIVLQKPIFIPYGEYFMELRRTRQMGQTSQTFVSDIVFRRDFTIAEESPTFVMGVKDEDLSVFPVKIRSEPENADVYVDGKKVGKTPYEGIFPLGEHKLALRKDGYFEHSEDLKVDINTPYSANVKMQTSVAGAHLNNAKLAMDRQMYQDAVNELAEALNSKPAETEVARANYMLGVCYLSLNDIQRAMGYFEQAKGNEDWRYKSMLGLVNGYAMMQRIDRALPLLVEVMLKNKDESVKAEANDLFQKISPFRSVIYVYSEPSGAQVTVNDKVVGQATPVILHELPLGNYRIRVEKAGYQPTDLNLSLSVNEFNPVIVKLKPIPK